MKRWMRRLAFLAALVALVFLLRLTVWRPDPVDVEIHSVDRGRVESTVVNSRAGAVKSRLSADMSPGIAGLVKQIAVKKGQRVERGQLLIQLDDAEHRANAQLSERSLEAARSSAEEACLAADQAARDLVRVEGLFARKVASDQELEEAQTRAQTTQAECTAARARARQAEAALVLARATLDKTAMRAPFDGVVLDVTTEVGEWISPSPPGVMIPPVVQLNAPEAIYVSAPIDEADVAELRVGMPCRVSFDAFRGQDFEGRVSYVASHVEALESQNRTLEVEATLEDGELPPNLLPGLSADVEIILEARENALRVPSFALLEGDHVLKLDGDRLRKVAVQTGLRNWEFVEISGGLDEGDRIVTSLDRTDVVAGARVRVVDSASRP